MRTSLQQLKPSPILSGQKLMPFEESGIAFCFESLSAVDVAVEIEVIMERGLGRGEFLQVRHSTEP